MVEVMPEAEYGAAGAEEEESWVWDVPWESEGEESWVWDRDVPWDSEAQWAREAQLAKVCRTLLARVGLGDLWTEEGPTWRARKLLGYGQLGELGPGELERGAWVLLRIADAIWDRRRLATDLAEALDEDSLRAMAKVLDKDGLRAMVKLRWSLEDRIGHSVDAWLEGAGRALSAPITVASRDVA